MVNLYIMPVCAHALCFTKLGLLFFFVPPAGSFPIFPRHTLVMVWCGAIVLRSIGCSLRTRSSSLLDLKTFYRFFSLLYSRLWWFSPRDLVAMGYYNWDHILLLLLRLVAIFNITFYISNLCFRRSSFLGFCFLPNLQLFCFFVFQGKG